MGIPGLSSFVWHNRDILSNYFLCHPNKNTVTLNCIHKKTNDDDNKQEFESTVIETIFNRKKEWIVFDAYSISPLFFNSSKNPWMNFWEGKQKLNEWIKFWRNCGFKLLFVFDGYKEWINSGKLDESLRRHASRYREIHEMNEILNSFHNHLNKNDIESRKDDYIIDDEKDEKKDDDYSNKNGGNKNKNKNQQQKSWWSQLNDSIYSGYSRFIIDIFYQLSDNENIKVFVTKTEADQQIMGWVQQNIDITFGICSLDSDFYVFQTENIWIINAKSIKIKKELRNYKNRNNFYKKEENEKQQKSDKDLIYEYLNGNNIKYPCLSFVATQSNKIWQFLDLNDNYLQRLYFVQLIGCDISENKVKPSQFVEHFGLKDKIKNVDDYNQTQIQIAKISKTNANNDEYKLDEKIIEFYKVKPMDLCSVKPSKDELLNEGYFVAKHVFQQTSDKLKPIHILLEPVRKMMYKRYIKQIKNQKITEYQMIYDDDKQEMKLKKIEYGINDLSDIEELEIIQRKQNDKWSFYELLALLKQVKNLLIRLNLINGFKKEFIDKANAMIEQLKYKRIYTSSWYSIYKDSSIDNDWNIQNAIKCYNNFSHNLLMKPIDLHIQNIFIRCIEYITYCDPTPPIQMFFTGSLYHFFCKYINQQRGTNSMLPLPAIRYNNNYTLTTSKLIKKQYLFKSINDQNVICYNNNFQEVIFSLNGLSVNEIETIKQVINEGVKERKDVNIVVIENHSKNNNVIRKISHAIKM